MIRPHKTLIFAFVCLISFTTAIGQRPQLVVQTGHGQEVLALAISPDKKLLASGGSDRKIVVWNIPSGKQIYSLSEHTQSVLSLAFNHRGNLLASGGADGSVKIWDVARGVKLEEIAAQPKGVSCVAFSRDDKYLTIAGAEKKIFVWELSTRKVAFNLEGHEAAVEKIVFSADGKSLVSFGRDHTLVQWNWQSGKPQQETIYEPEIAVDHSLAISPDGNYVAAVSFNQDVLLWNLSTGEKKSIRFPIDVKQEVSPELFHLAFVSNDELVCDINNEILGWKFQTQEVRKIGDTPKSRGSALSISADTKLLVYSYDQTIKTVDLNTKVEQTFIGGFETINTLDFWSEGRTLFANGRFPHFLGEPFEFEGLEAGYLFATLSGRRFEYIAAINSLANLGKTKEEVSSNIELRIFDPKNKPGPRIIKAHDQSISAMSAQRNDGKLFATCSEDKTLKIWNVSNWEKPERVFKEDARDLVFSPDGKWLAVITSGPKVKLFDTKSWRSRVVYERKDGGLGPLYFTPDSSRIAFHEGFGIGDQYLVVSDITGQNRNHRFSLSPSPPGLDFKDFIKMSPFPGLALHRWLSQSLSKGSVVRGPLSFSKDEESSLMAYQYEDLLKAVNSIKIWDLNSGAEVANLLGHTGVIRGTAFSPSGKILASGSDDTTLKLWDIEKNKELATISTLADRKWVIYTPEGRFDTNTDLENDDLLHWSIPGNALTTLPLDVFRRDYYEPKLLDRLLACTENNTCDKGEFKRVRSLSELNTVRPNVKITNISLPDAERRVKVSVEVASTSGMVEQGNGRQVKRSSDVYDLRLLRNRQLVGYWPQDGALKIQRRRAEIDESVDEMKFETELKIWRESTRLQLDPKTGKQTVTFEVQLPKGKDASSINFTAYAFNEDRVKSQTANYEWSREQKENLPKADLNAKRRAYVVSVGVNESRIPRFRLSLSNYDVNQFQSAVAEKLGKVGIYEVIPIQLVTAYEDGRLVEDATKQNIETIFELLAGKEVAAERKQKIPNAERVRKATPDDLIIVTFSSHGYSTRGGDFYLLPSDVTRKSERQKVPDLSSMISGEELALWVRDIEGQMAWIIDACQSAAAIESLDFKPGPLGSRGFGQLAYDKRMRVLVATQSDNVAIQVDGKIKGGLLTEALIAEGLIKGQADTDQNGEIMLDEWLEYAAEQVPGLFRVAIKEVNPSALEKKQITLKAIDNSQNFDLRQLKSLQRASFFNFSNGPDDILVGFTIPHRR